MWDRIKAPHISVARILSLARVSTDVDRFNNLKRTFTIMIVVVTVIASSLELSTHNFVLPG